MKLLLTTVILLCVLLCADSPDAARSGSAEASFATRPFQLALGGLQAVNNGLEPLYQINVPPVALASEADVVYLHMETYGLPWNDFVRSEEPPESHPWTAVMNTLAQRNQESGKRTYLAMLLTREYLAHNAEVRNGSLYINDRWAPTCFDFTASSPMAASANSWRVAYLNYVRWMVRKFKPQYVNTAVEINAYWEKCTNRGQPVAQWNAVVDIANAAYDAVKALNPETVVFPSIVANDLYGYTTVSDQCVRPMSNEECDALAPVHYEAAYAALAGLKRDRFALSAWPHAAETYDRESSTYTGKDFLIPATIPPDYFTRAADRGGERLFIAETGWISDDLVIKPRTDLTCFAILPGHADYQREYLELLFERAQSGGVDVIAWWSVYDALPEDVMTGCYPYSNGPLYEECSGDIWCADANYFRNKHPENPPFGELLFKAYGTAGMKRYDGTLKDQAYEVWQQTLAKPYVPNVGARPRVR